MASTTLRSRPWQLLGRNASSLTATPTSSLAKASTAVRPWQASIISRHAGRNGGGSRGYRSVATRFQQDGGTPSPKSEAISNTKFKNGILPSQMLQSVIPQTLIPPPFFRGIFSDTKTWWKWTKIRVKVRGQQFLQRRGLWWASKTKVFGSARFNPSRRSLIPTAKAMHSAMSEAFARGDLVALQKVVTQTTHKELAARIQRRKPLKPGHRREWELIKYTKSWSYPRIVDHQAAQMPTGVMNPEPMVEQAVVAISSQQRLVEYDDFSRSGEVPGSSKVVDLVEYVVIARTIHSGTWATEPWRLIGTIDPTDLQKWEEDGKLMENMAAAEMLKGRR